MSVLKLTKNELRNQQTQLNQLQRYLPTLQLKKSMLQFEVNNVYTEITVLKEELVRKKSTIEGFSSLLLEKVDYDLTAYADIQYVKKRYENIAGVEIPIFEQVVFRPPVYFLYDTPAWTESATALLQDMVVVREQLGITQEKRRALERELREVSIRVNLFEKILIPRAQENIKKIRIFLGDQMLTAVAQAKVAKAKILKAKKMEAE
jgi:V/A-type H+-transporting ATPase subunit D